MRAALVGVLLGTASLVSAPVQAQVPAWVLEKPAPETQTQKSSRERGGVNPCSTPDPGFGGYEPWDRSPSMGQMIVPKRLRSKQSFDVMIHFHGHEAARKEWVQAITGPVFVGIDLGLGSGPYLARFQQPTAFRELLLSVQHAVAEQIGADNIRIRRVGLSAWSAGYGAVEQILRQDTGRQLVDTVILLDGLHAGYRADSLNADPLAPFVHFAQQAARGQRFMFVTHSSIIPPGYASTTETASYLIHSLGGRPVETRPRGTDPMGLDLIRLYVQGHFHVRGYAGNDKMDHCAHLGLLRDVVRVHLRRRWR